MCGRPGCADFAEHSSLLEISSFSQSDDATNPDRMYDLTAVVVHCGR